MKIESTGRKERIKLPFSFSRLLIIYG